MTEKQRKTILDAVVAVLRSAGRPLSAAEIHGRIVSAGLFEFGAKDPVAMVRSTIQKHLRATAAGSSHVRRTDRDAYAIEEVRAKR